MDERDSGPRYRDSDRKRKNNSFEGRRGEGRHRHRDSDEKFKEPEDKRRRYRESDDRHRDYEDRFHRDSEDKHRRNRGNDDKYEEHEDFRRNKDNRKRREKFRRFDDKRDFEDSREKSDAPCEWGRPQDFKKEPKVDPQDKEKPNFGLSGKLTEDTNTVNGVVIKYSEPLDARKPKRRWRLYPFKGEKALPTLYIHRQSAYLMGRDRKIADIPLDHPSCSKQHAALQYRLVSFQKENGFEGRRVRPYLIDLDSANGTFVNNVKLEARRFHEILERDVIKFGFSSREYVLLHEQSKDDALDDDVTTEA